MTKLLIPLLILLTGCATLEPVITRVPVQFHSERAAHLADQACSATCAEQGRVVHISEPDRCICGDLVEELPGVVPDATLIQEVRAELTREIVTNDDVIICRITQRGPMDHLGFTCENAIEGSVAPPQHLLYRRVR